MGINIQVIKIILLRQVMAYCHAQMHQDNKNDSNTVQ